MHTFVYYLKWARGERVDTSLEQYHNFLRGLKYYTLTCIHIDAQIVM